LYLTSACDSIASPGCDLTIEAWEAAKRELERPRPFVHPYDILVGVDWEDMIVRVFRAPKKKRKRKR
jgi:hypothetical protein